MSEEDYIASEFQTSTNEVCVVINDILFHFEIIDRHPDRIDALDENGERWVFWEWDDPKNHLTK